MKGNLRLERALAAAFLACALTNLPAAQRGTLSGGSPPGLVDHEIQELRALPDRAEPMLLPVRLDGGEYLLDLHPRPVRSVDFRVLVPRGGKLVPYPAPASRTVEGSVVGFEGSRVVGSVVDDGISLEIDLGDGRTWEIQPETELVSSAVPSPRHVVFRSTDVFNEQVFGCGTTEGMRPLGPRTHVAPVPQGRSAVTGNEIFDLACDADFDYFNLYGTVEAVVTDIEDILHRVRITYEVELALSMEITTIVVRDTIVNPYVATDATALLGQMTTEWNSNPDLGANVRRDIAELFTGKNLDGSVIGIAWVGVVCDDPTSGLGYNLVQSRFTGNKTLRKCLSAHEIGHNWDADHCNGTVNCGIMCSGINGCPGGCSIFGMQATAQITAYKASRGCLTTEQDELPSYFLDEFPGGTLDALKWSYNDGGEVNGDATNEITGPSALDLNAAGLGAYQDDDVRTHWTDFSGLLEGSVSYYVQHKGVEAGEELVLEYRSEDKVWIELDRVTSDGVDETVFELREIGLPGDALHPDFRLSFRTEVNETDDHWYVDNLAAGHFRDVTIQTDPLPEPVTASVNDNHGNGGGTSPFDRTYNDGTPVILTAPASSAGLDFVDWYFDGVPAGSGPALSLTVGAESVIEARYRETFSLTVTSTGAASVPITISPLDRNGDGSGTTPIARAYFDGTQVQLSAPTLFGGRYLTRWTVDGVPQLAGSTLTVDMSQPRIVNAHYSYMFGRPRTKRP